MYHKRRMILKGQREKGMKKETNRRQENPLKEMPFFIFGNAKKRDIN